jgi:hypothetical protein
VAFFVASFGGVVPFQGREERQEMGLRELAFFVELFT